MHVRGDRNGCKHMVFKSLQIALANVLERVVETNLNLSLKPVLGKNHSRKSCLRLGNGMTKGQGI